MITAKEARELSGSELDAIEKSIKEMCKCGIFSMCWLVGGDEKNYCMIVNALRNSGFNVLEEGQNPAGQRNIYITW